MRRITCQQCTVRHLTCITDLPVESLPEFQACGVMGLYKPRQIVFHEGTPASGLHVLCQGTVKLYRSDRFGREYIVEVATAGAILSELGGSDDDVYSTSAETLSEAQISFLPRERLAGFLERHPKTGVRLLATLGRALAATRRKAGELALKRADARMADLLLRLADGAAQTTEAGKTRVRVRLAYSRRDLAEMIGVSTETAIRLLAKLKRNRMILTDGDGIDIVDLERLTRLARHGDIAA